MDLLPITQDAGVTAFSVIHLYSTLGCFTQAASVSHVHHDYSTLIDICLLLIKSQLPTCMVLPFLLMHF